MMPVDDLAGLRIDPTPETQFDIAEQHCASRLT
jgi:hypothetical protein